MSKSQVKMMALGNMSKMFVIKERNQILSKRMPKKLWNKWFSSQEKSWK